METATTIEHAASSDVIETTLKIVGDGVRHVVATTLAPATTDGAWGALLPPETVAGPDPSGARLALAALTTDLGEAGAPLVALLGRSGSRLAAELLGVCEAWQNGFEFSPEDRERAVEAGRRLLLVLGEGASAQELELVGETTANESTADHAPTASPIAAMPLDATPQAEGAGLEAAIVETPILDDRPAANDTSAQPSSDPMEQAEPTPPGSVWPFAALSAESDASDGEGDTVLAETSAVAPALEPEPAPRVEPTVDPFSSDDGTPIEPPAAPEVNLGNFAVPQETNPDYSGKSFTARLQQGAASLFGAREPEEESETAAAAEEPVAADEPQATAEHGAVAEKKPEEPGPIAAFFASSSSHATTPASTARAAAERHRSAPEARPNDV